MTNFLPWRCHGCWRGKLEEELVDKPGTTIATCFTCNGRRESACWRSSWQIIPNIFRGNFGGDITDLRIDCWCAMTSCFGRWWKPVWFSKRVFLKFSSNLDGTLSRLEFSELFSPPINFNCPSSVFGNYHQFGRARFFRVELFVVEFWCVHHVQSLKVHHHKNSFSNYLSQRTRLIRGVFRVILCSRIGGISIGQKTEMEWYSFQRIK